jgi:hypothetical protein
MKIHNFMAGLASAALATMLGTAAYAEGPAKHKGLYVSGALGANWANDSDVSGGASGEVDFDVNWVGAVAVGYGFGNGSPGRRIVPSAQRCRRFLGREFVG